MVLKGNKAAEEHLKPVLLNNDQHAPLLWGGGDRVAPPARPVKVQKAAEC